MSSQWEVIECRSCPGRVAGGESWQLAKLASRPVVSSSWKCYIMLIAGVHITNTCILIHANNYFTLVVQ